MNKPIRILGIPGFGKDDEQTFVASGINRGCEAESLGRFHQVGERVGFHLVHHPTPVCLHRNLTYPEPQARPVRSTGRRPPAP
jgi:hypothetical protein